MQLPPANPEAPRRLVDHDGYQVQYLPQSNPEGLERFNFVVMRTYRIEPGQVAQPVRTQRAMRFADVYYDEVVNPLQSPLRYETDLMPPKPACDVVVNGHCYAPGGEATQVTCSLRVGDNPPKKVLVLGDRSVWIPKGSKRAFLNPARPFAVMPLRWENAYGGVAVTQMGPVPHQANPAGMGYFIEDFGDVPPKDRWGPLPNLEDPERPLRLDALLVDPTDWKKGPRPTGFGWVPKHWAPRSERAGLDPGLRPIWDMLHGNPPPGAKDALPFKEMDPAYLNGAPEGQVVPHPNGGELVVLEHLHPTEEQLRFRLPVDHPQLRWDCGRGMSDVKLKMDSITIEPDLMLLDVVWRGWLPAPENFSLEEDYQRVLIEVDGEPELPAKLLDTGFPIELITEGEP